MSINTSLTQSIHTHQKLTPLMMVLSISLMLTACGGSNPHNTSGSNNTRGTLVKPENAKIASAKILATETSRKQKESCPNVPSGYSPLTHINVEFLDVNDQVLNTTTTDECGYFSTVTSDQVTQIKAQSTGNRDIISNVENFQQSGTEIASCIPASAQYKIASMQFTDNNKLGFTITDTITNKAVIGVPESALTVTINNTPESIQSLQNAVSANDPASVVLVMDASSSMSSRVKDSNGETLIDNNGKPYTRNRISALAAHTYLDNVDIIDETAMILFSSTVNFIDDGSIANLFGIRDNQSHIASYTFSTDGFTTNPASLRFIVDAYNKYSTLYRSYGYDNKHTDTPDLHINYYTLGGLTAFYDAVYTGINKISSRQNTRKIVIAMSDGQDNRSLNTESSVIADAKSKGIPVYTIAYAQGNDETMKRIATETSASYFIVNDLNLIGAFQSIQTGIIYQYLAGLSKSVASNDVLELTLNYNGIEVSRSLQR